MTIPDPDEIQSQVTAVARLCNHEDPTNTAIRSDGGFLLSRYRQLEYRRKATNKVYLSINSLFAGCYFDPVDQGPDDS